jgi:hypothetical protein
MSLVGMSREQIERHLDAGELEVEMSNGRWWAIRRNGMTKTWKRDPQRYEIPVKAGLKSYGTIMPSTLPYFRVKKEDEE